MEPGTRYWLRSHVYVSHTEDGAVFLDLKSNKYFGFGPTEIVVLKKLLADWPSSINLHPDEGESSFESNAIVQELLKLQLITPDPTQGKGASAIILDCSNGIGEGQNLQTKTSIRMADVWNFVLACAHASTKLRTSSIESIVCRAEARKQSRQKVSQGSPLRFQDKVFAFCRLRPLVYSAKNACLFDSFVLIEFLARYDIYPTWVFGVRTQPFGAHSWVQEGELVLNDLPERVRAFTPILAI